LAHFAGAYYFIGVHHRGRPIETLPVGLSDKCSWPGVVAANSTMDVLQKQLPVLDGDAVLEDVGVAFLVEIPINDNEGLSPVREPPSLRLIGREHLTE
jgi:hypothetical protein